MIPYTIKEGQLITAIRSNTELHIVKDNLYTCGFIFPRSGIAPAIAEIMCEDGVKRPLPLIYFTRAKR
ncbi:hypothetical protein EVB91_151 [Rhizobium phage RHph_I1_18]|nr:hypothetical protein EVB91_151 [Rhizobium phage RHph_I1_18]